MLRALFRRGGANADQKTATENSQASASAAGPAESPAASLRPAEQPAPVVLGRQRTGSDEDLLSALLEDGADGAPAVAASRPVAAPKKLTPAQEAALEVRRQEILLARLFQGTVEAVAKSALYFSEENVRALGGRQIDGPALLSEIDNRARALLMRAEASAHCQRMMGWAGEGTSSYRAAERGALLFRLLHEDRQAVPALPILRRVADNARRVLLLAAATLESGDPAEAERMEAALSEMAAVRDKARGFLYRTPALLPPAQERMARAALHCLMVAAVCAARVAHQWALLARGEPADERDDTAAAADARGGDLQPLPGAVTSKGRRSALGGPARGAEPPVQLLAA